MLRRKLRWTTFWLGLVLVMAFAAKMVEIGGGDRQLIEYGKAVYDFFKDMAVVIVTIAAAWLAAVLQRRSKFIESLEEEWRRIVRTKSELFAYCEKAAPSYDEYIAVFRSISDTVDMMRIVYRNVGETGSKVGLHPYVPLQDMRRAIQTLDPSKRNDFTEAERKVVSKAIIQSWNALRETFLEELDLEEPETPILIHGAVRSKKPGATERAIREQQRQLKWQRGLSNRNADIDKLLDDAWDREHNKRDQEELQAPLTPQRRA